MNQHLVVCGPSASGKTTLLNRLLAEFGTRFGYSISNTTRRPRAGEVDGDHYHFVSHAVMERDIQMGKFVQSVVYAGNLYGTSRAAVEAVLASGRICVHVIDVEGVKNIKAIYHDNPYYVFIQPPSLAVLEDRLGTRGSDSKMAERLEAAEAEMRYGLAEGNFDLVLMNEDLDTAYQGLKDFVVDKFRLL